MISTFSHIVAPNFDEILCGVFITKKESKIEIFDNSPHFFSVDSLLSDLLILDSKNLGFYDYFSNQIGVIDIAAGRISWQASAGEKKDLDFVGSVPEMRWIITQSRGNISILSSESGELIERRQISGILRGFGREWHVETHKNSIIFKTGYREVVLPRKEAISFVHQFGNLVVIIERQGPITIVEISNGGSVFTKHPDPGSEFSKAFVADDLVLFSQHFFDRPEVTILHRYKGLSNTIHQSVTLPCSGRYTFAKNGKEIAFANRRVYSCITGECLRIL